LLSFAAKRNRRYRAPAFRENLKEKCLQRGRLSSENLREYEAVPAQNKMLGSCVSIVEVGLELRALRCCMDGSPQGGNWGDREGPNVSHLTLTHDRPQGAVRLLRGLPR